MSTEGSYCRQASNNDIPVPFSMVDWAENAAVAVLFGLTAGAS